MQQERLLSNWKERGKFLCKIFGGMRAPGIGGTVGSIDALVFVGLALALPILILRVIGFVYISGKSEREKG